MLSLAFISRERGCGATRRELKGETAPVDEILRLDQEWRGHQFKAESSRLSKTSSPSSSPRREMTR